MQSIVIKVGSNVLTKTQGELDLDVMRSLCSQIADLKSKGHEIIFISSGAVASGRSLVALPEKTDDVSRRQVLAAIGQVKLIHGRKLDKLIKYYKNQLVKLC